MHLVARVAEKLVADDAMDIGDSGGMVRSRRRRAREVAPDYGDFGC